MHHGARPIRSLCLAFLCVTVFAEVAAAQPADAPKLVFVGLRPLKQERGGGALQRLGEAQQLRRIAENVLAQASHQTVVGHDDLKQLLGNDYLVRWFNCEGKSSCVTALLAPLVGATYRTAVTGQYFVSGGAYHIRILTFSLEDGALGKTIEFELATARVKDPELWRAKLAPLVEVARGRVHLASNVTDAKCLLDGVACAFDADGQTMTVPPGDHTIELSKDGYGTEKSVVSVKSEATQEVTLTLNPVAGERPNEGSGSGSGSGSSAGPDPGPGPGPGPAAGNRGPTLVAFRTDQPPSIDGKIDDAVWQKAALQTSFTQNFPDENKPPTERTEMRVLYDDAAVYVAVRCFDAQPDKIVARLTRRDRDIDADKITVDIGSKNDHASAYHFEVNAAGRQLDGTHFNDTDFNTDWDGLWYSSVTRDELGWSAELAIPLVALRYNGDTTSFGFQVRRYLSRRQEVDEWSYVPRTAQGEVSYYGELDGLTGLNAKRLFQIVPYDSRRATFRTQQGPLDGSKLGGNIGADVKIGLTSALTLDATINPDFGTVEVDQVVLNLSTVETFFPEKRPFFIEGADLFSTPFQLFYSRRVGRTPPSPRIAADVVEIPPEGQILGAAKVTGLLANRLSIGVLDAITAREDTVISRGMGAPDEKILVEPLTNFGVLRLRREFGVNSSLGLMATSVNRIEPAGAAAPMAGDGCPRPHGGLTGTAQPVMGRCTNDAYTGGIDTVLRTSDGKWGASGQLVGSVLEHGPGRLVPDGTLIKPGDLGWGVTADAGKYGGKNWLYRVHYSYMNPTLQINDAGFNGSANDQLIQGVATLRSKTPVWKFRDTSLALNLIYETFPDTHQPTARWIPAKWTATLRNFWTVGATLGAYLPYYDNRETRDGALLENPTGYTFGVNAQTDPRKSVVISVNTGGEHQLRGVSAHANVTVNLHPASFVELDLISNGTWAYGIPRWMNTEMNMDLSRTYYFADLDARSWDALVRGTWTFSPTVSLQAYAQVYLDRGQYGKVTSVTASGSRPLLNDAAFTSAATGALVRDDFRDSAVNVNAFLRWEFLPGSALWLVYTRNQTNLPYDPMEGVGRLRLDKLNGPSTDVVLVKLSYLWEPLRSR
jgi:hypothetical protein